MSLDADRAAAVERRTNETTVAVRLVLDGTGES
jgi:imidazoleglycerol phosphate dehydratase HisB